MEALADYHYLVLLLYLLLYLGLFLIPFLREAIALRPKEDLVLLRKKLAADLINPDVADSTDTGVMRTLGEGTEEEADLVEEEDEEGNSNAKSSEVGERLSRLEALTFNYESPLVREAIAQIRVQYPTGNYQQFKLELLPAFASYSERIAAVRNMAGLFVLIGLGLTMIRLNAVVDQIAVSSSTTTISSEEFLARMGSIMTNIGGAFISSIIGLALMIGAMFLAGAIDRSVQRRLQEVEHMLTQEAIPTLVELHQRFMPDFTLANLLRNTGTQLRRLDQTVGGLTTGMAHTLSGLGDQIDNMLGDFRSFQEQYVQLNDLLKHLREASQNLSRTTEAIDGAARRLQQPINEFNESLLRHLDTVADSVQVTREGHAQLSEQMAVMGTHIDDIVMEMRGAMQTYIQGAAEREQAVREQMDQHARTLSEQNDRIERQLKTMTQALTSNSSVQLDAALRNLHSTVAVLQRSADGFASVTGKVARYAGSYPSFFSWTMSMIERTRGRVTNGRANA